MSILKPFICGKKHLFFPSICSSASYFVGTVDTTIPQGSDFSLTDGVKAYDEDGVSLPFTVTPSSLNTCSVGRHQFVYEAEGATDTRTITVVAIGNPVISGLTPILNVKVGDTVNTMEDVSAVDGNGNSISVSCSEGSSVTYTTAGVHILHYMATDGCGNSTAGTRTVAVETNEAIVCQSKVCEAIVGCDEPTPPTPTTATVRVHIVTDGTVDDTRGGSVVGGGTYDIGTSATVRATTNSGYAFYQWSKSPTGSPIESTSISYTFTVTEDVDLYAIVDAYTPPTPTPTTYTVGVYGVGHGSVSGGGVYEEGTTITIRATPDSGYHFKQWRVAAPGGQVASYGATFTWTVNGDINFYAIFEEDVAPTTYTVEVYSLGNGSVSGGGVYEEGTTITISATPNIGYRLKEWRVAAPGGQIASYGTTFQWTVNEDFKFYARFEEDGIYTTDSVGVDVYAGNSDTIVMNTIPVTGTPISVSISHYGAETLSFTAGSSASRSVGDFHVSYDGDKRITVDGTDADEEQVTHPLTVNSVSYYY